MQKNYLDVAKIRSKFPIFQQMVHGHPFIYFDSASTAQVPVEVVEAIAQYYLQYKSNVGRGIYQYAEDATFAFEQARSSVAEFIGTKAEQVVFTSGATASINLVAQTWASSQLKAGDEILLSGVEHNSNFLPWQQLSMRLGCTVKKIAVTREGVIDYDDFEKKLSHKTKLMAIVHSSNLVGGTNDIAKIVARAHDVGAVVLVDAAQSIAHQKIDVGQLGCDFLAFSGHKLFGPTGIGILYASKQMSMQMQPWQLGGGMVLSVGDDECQYKPYPHGFEAGTQNIAGAMGLRAAINFVRQNIDFSLLAQHEALLSERLITGLQKIADITIISATARPQHGHIHLVTFISAKYHAHDVAAYLDQQGIAVRAGNHCVYVSGMEQKASVRVSFSVYNTVAEVDFLLEKLQQLCS